MCLKISQGFSINFSEMVFSMFPCSLNLVSMNSDHFIRQIVFVLIFEPIFVYDREMFVAYNILISIILKSNNQYFFKHELYLLML